MRIVACDDDGVILELIETWIKEWMGKKSYQYISYDNGIDVAKIVNREYGNTVVIFISGYTEYFEDSFEADPVYFLIKPIKKENFEKAMEKAIKKVSENDKKYLLVTGKEIKRVFYEEIYYAESFARKIKLHCTFGELEFYEKMDELEKQLQGEFVRCHKSFLVNMEHIRCVDGNEITLLDGDQVPVSKKKATETKRTIFEYLGRKL